jgi:hypothetical protein
VDGVKKYIEEVVLYLKLLFIEHTVQYADGFSRSRDDHLHWNGKGRGGIEVYKQQLS